jgi:hypothetical protein
MNKLVTPADVENKLISLSKELDEAHAKLETAETDYGKTKPEWDLEVAKTRFSVRARANESGRKMTVQEIEDEALILCELQYVAFCAADAMVRVARSNVNRIKVQIDIARSVGTAVRAAMDMG